jgi:DNA-binding response OmpR family regulator
LNEIPAILLIGNDTTLNYLLGRFAERCGYQLTAHLENSSVEEITVINPAVIVFPSIEILETFQALVVELTSLDFPIIVCSSVADEVRARELGADYCLLHPLTYDDFQTALTAAGVSKYT